MNSAQKRTNQEWLNALSGKLGQEEQNAALFNLANYLFVIINKYLQNRRNSLFKLRFCTDEEIRSLAEETVQRFMKKLVKEDFELLTKYSGQGRFPAWAAQVAVNLCRSELRRKAWHTTRPLEGLGAIAEHESIGPEKLAIQVQLREQMIFCLDQLPERYRIALIQIIIEGDSAAEVGEILGISANAVSILVYRGKKRLRVKFDEAGIGLDALAAFV